MIHNVKGLFVEIQGEMFPAGNIQVWTSHPELHWIANHGQYGTWYGLYFDIMFEDGHCLSVEQEAAAIANETCSSMCEADPNVLTHYLISLTHKNDYSQVIFAWHAIGEEELHRVLTTERKRRNEPIVNLDLYLEFKLEISKIGRST